MLQDRRNVLYIICAFLNDTLLHPLLTDAGIISAKAALKLAPILHNNANNTSAGLYNKIRTMIKEHPTWSLDKKVSNNTFPPPPAFTFT